MRISVDSSRCQGHGRCYAHAPDLFDPADDDGHAEVLMGEVSSDDAALVTAIGRAVIDCPEQAITVQ